MSSMIYKKEGHTATIKIEEQSAAILWEELDQMLKDLEKDNDVYVLILAGEDLEKTFENLCPEKKEQLTRQIEKLRVPVIASSGKSLPEDYLGSDLTVSEEDFMEEAKQLAEVIAQNAPLAVQQIKRCVNLGHKTDIDTGLAYELQAFSLCHSSKEKEIRMKKLIDGRQQ